MKHPRRTAAKSRLEQLLSEHPLTEGMYVRTWGDHLIIGREEPFGPDGELEASDRLKITLQGTAFGLSVRRHTGRWEKTFFTGTLEELVDVILTFMQHLVAPYS